MARRKKGKSGKKGRKAGRASRPKAESLPPIPDRRAMEGIIRQILPGPADGETPLDQAQQLMYEAFDAEGLERAELARQALEICPDCADAYVLLAEEAGRLDEALKLYEQGLSAGRRAIGEKAFEEHEGHFWGILETRPYMRARLGLAQCLWAARRREEAADHYREMLRLNPDDNQGVRYVLASCLLDLDRDDELSKLLEGYEDDASTEWAYTKALLAYRQEGDSERACKLLKRAVEANEHIPHYLVGARPMPRQMPEYVTFGGEDEAASYVAGSLSGWRNSPGAIPWVRRVLKVSVPPPPSRRGPPWRRLKAVLAGLPQEEGEVWQVDIRPCPLLKDEAAAALEPWAVVITNPEEDTILRFEVEEERPTTGRAWKQIIEAMLEPEEGEPHRPEQIEVRLRSYQTTWRSKLDQIGVACVLREELPHVDAIVDGFASAAGTAGGGADGAAPTAADLLELAQTAGEVWQADIRRLPTWVGAEGDPQRPWTALVTNRSEDLILAQDLTLEPPAGEWLWTSVSRAMQQPAAGRPHRPGVVQVASPEYRDALKPHLETVGVECVVCEDLDQLDFVFNSLSEHLAEDESEPALVEVPGLGPEQIGSFFQAAADFYQQAPWRKVPGDSPIKVECAGFGSGTWYAVVMGQSGMTLGLALYEDLDTLEALLSGDISEEEHARRVSSLSVTFGEAFEMPVKDLEAAEKRGWPVAGPQAYPWPIRVNPGRAVRPALAWELGLLEACMRAIPELVAQKGESVATTVRAASGDVELRLSWLD